MFFRCRTVLRSAAVLVLAGAAVLAGVGTPAAAAPAPVAADHVLTVLGAGPYRLGGRLAPLVAAGLVTEPAAPDADGRQVVTSLGDWPGELLLTFIGGRLAVLETATDAVRTAVGARVGMSFDQVDRLYHGAGRLLTTADGGPAYLVRYGPLVMVFGDHPIRPGVGAITTGPARIVLPDLGIPAGDRRVRLSVRPPVVRAGGRVVFTGLVPTSGPLACPLDNEAILTSPLFPPEGFGPAVTRDSSGRFRTTYTVPAGTPPGPYDIGLRCGGGNLGVSATLRVV
ncbi:hypothetical protein GCM10020358_09020 [Amorphoplanes nipponensis]|uniref:Uncharacterized protein n=1 Tax=Actinoplanes nipponensis TaxID=135950 RepID=A0A919MRF6_9ACTN|nr:hypothetical protein [Actinoplanes nipponensis]GIE54172.1 hypothetical protein Ani05nite_77060 [Actinoplanes nipponensis]